MAFMRIRLNQIKAQDPSLESFEEQVVSMGIPHYQIVSPTNGQTVFEVTKPYQQGTGQLKVYLNGMKMRATSNVMSSDGDYRETEQDEISFVQPLQEDDIVEIRIEGAGQGVAMVTDHYHAYQEEPIGLVNGSNKVFTLSRAPKQNSECLYVNGRIMKRGTGNDYTISTNIITFSEAPSAGSVLIVNYDTATKN